MFVLGLVIGVVVGYLFKPQIDKLINYIKSVIQENKNKQQ